MPEKNILIADDDQEVLDILKEMIQREGYRVFLTSNGKEAVEAIKINPIDLAILDIKMPVMDGILGLPDMEYLEIRVNEKIAWSVGTPLSDHTIEKELPLIQRHNNRDISIGILRVVTSLDAVYQRLMDKILTILISNAIKTFLVSN